MEPAGDKLSTVTKKFNNASVLAEKATQPEDRANLNFYRFMLLAAFFALVAGRTIH